MIDTTPVITEAVQALIDCPDEVVPARMLAPIVKMNVDVIIKYAKEKKWSQCAYIVSGKGKNARVKFFRRDFLQKNGFIPKEEKKTTEQLLEDLISAVNRTNEMLEKIVERWAVA